jgi:murein DD-endopeptidase MepM/ murein hydrolase activator NlpD
MSLSSRLAHSCLFRVAYVLVCLCAAASPLQSGQKASHGSSLTKRRKTPLSEHQCGPGVVLKLSAPESRQGALLLLELRSAKALDQVSATWTEKDISFWEENKAEEKNPDVWRALLGIDLELKAGDYPLALTGKLSGTHNQVSCIVHIPVREGKFATERLSVAPNFVEPNAEQLARAEAERQRLRAIFATITPERLWQGAFRIPLDGATTGGNFGKRRILNGQPGSPHGGVDFPAPAGTPVYAAQRGRVVLAEPLYFSGNTVVLDHGLGLYTFYAHFESIAVQAGDLVDTGALLGKVGATGRVTGPHLHWGVTVNRSRANPLDLIALLAKAASRS